MIIKKIFHVVGVMVLGLFAVSLGFSSPAEARVRVKTKTIYYDISGNNGVALYKSMLKKGPKASGLQHAIASTAPKINFGKPKGMQNRIHCKISDVDIVVNITYTYPRWRNQKRASPQLRRAWRKLEKELVRHEETHGKIVVATANKIYREILRERGRVSRGCKDYGKRLLAKLPRVIKSYERKQRAFDRREGYGFSRVSRLQKRLIRAR